MKSFLIAFLLVFTLKLQASGDLERARQLEESGDSSGARALLAHAVESAPRDIAALTEYAEFLDCHADPGAVEAYEKLLGALDTPAHQNQRAVVARRMAELALLRGDSAAAARFLGIVRAAGGTASLPAAQTATPAAGISYVEIPGPLRSFGRMAAIASDAQPDDLLPALARNVVTNGFQAAHSNEALEQTEYLKLVHRYLSQAREIEKLAGDGKIIDIPNCDSANVADLLRVLGFRMRGGCGSEVVLETVNATRAFLTTDSGFPLPALEEALRTNRPFKYDYHPARVPVIFGPDYWLSPKEKETSGFLDVLLSDPAVCRLYLGISKLDRETAEAFHKNIPLAHLKAYAHVLDFFGGMFELREGKAVVPGAPRTVAAWTELVGVPPDQGAAFFEKLIAKDDGWLASYYDALARINGPVHDYLTEPARMIRFYNAIRGKVTSPGPARPVFRANADMMLLTARLWIEPNGQPHIPGNLQVWKDLFASHPQGKYDAKLTRAAVAWKEPDDVLEALFGLTRKAVENEPLKIFMALSDLDRYRAKLLAPATIDSLARNYHIYGSQYAIFNDAATLSDKSILQFLDTAEQVSRLKDPLLRTDVLGTMQGLVGLWQIFSRSGSLPAAKADETFAALLGPFPAVRDDRALFDAGREGVTLLITATGSKAGSPRQGRILDLLAGSADSSDVESHTQMVEEMMRILEAQQIVPLDDLFDVANHLDALAHGEKLNTALLNRLATRIAAIPVARANLSPIEKNALAFGYWTEKHLENERKLNIRVTIEKLSGDKLRDVRGLLAPFLRDTLVAYNYAHYAPPGAQVLYTNPVFVRSHDFLGMQASNHMWRTTEVFGSGWPSNGGGRLVGSLAGLPYALAEAEQNFLVPDQTQALIWGDLVPQMVVSAIVPRWWKVTPSQLHWVALHMRYGESLVAEAAIDADLRPQVLSILGQQAAPVRVGQITRLLAEGNVAAAMNNVTPSEFFVLASRVAADPGRQASPLLAEIRRIEKESPQQVNFAAISAAFGTPKPTLANSYRPELLNLRTFPTLMGYSSRILAESWESNTLYWAELADQTYLQPSQLNVRIPEWTERLVQHIFASHLEDWPAVLRSLREVGDDVRNKARQQATAVARQAQLTNAGN
ncbi:MAG: tetratricopeptide repeat protein [Bryobacteraceae bacterium]